ncbi:MAG: LPS export ABC transporter periplasmic protein LptC [Bacteroidota bacterium]|nr:LPS export ABC transporter periplasmic protein LptC [Bacteroidota bacterium]
MRENRRSVGNSGAARLRRNRILYSSRWGLLFLVLLTVPQFSACEKRLEPAKLPIEKTGEIPDQESWNTRVVFSDSGIVRAVLQAAHIRRFDARRETLLDSGIVVDFYTTGGAHSSRLTGDRGRVDDATNNLEAFDNVVFVSDSGVVVRTDYLFWNNAERKIRSDRFVTVTSPREKIQGYGFEADQSLRNYVIYRVSGEAEVRREE